MAMPNVRSQRLNSHSPTIGVVPRLLLINPNTSESMTTLLMRHARAELSPDIDVVPATARFGARVIASESAFAIAAHATLDVYASNPGPWNAVLLACFGDPALHALREISPAPVVSFADAAMAEAVSRMGESGRFAIVTGGVRWGPMLARLAAMLGYAHALAGVLTLSIDGGQIAANPDGAMTALKRAVDQAVERYAARTVILGGAGLAGLAARLQSQAPVPLIDSVLVGLRRAGELAREHAQGRVASAPARESLATQGLSRDLERLLGEAT
jgi:Asp/Glu/hydantoin racemase